MAYLSNDVHLSVLKTLVVVTDVDNGTAKITRKKTHKKQAQNEKTDSSPTSSPSPLQHPGVPEAPTLSLYAQAALAIVEDLLVVDDRTHSTKSVRLPQNIYGDGGDNNNAAPASVVETRRALRLAHASFVDALTQRYEPLKAQNIVDVVQVRCLTRAVQLRLHHSVLTGQFPYRSNNSPCRPRRRRRRYRLHARLL